MTAVAEQDIIDPVPEHFTLSSGIEVKITDLETRQALRLFRIITHGAPVYLEDGIGGLLEGETEQVIGRLLAMIVFSIPEAEDQSIEFLLSMVEPVGLEIARPTDKAARLRNESRWRDLTEYMQNPPLEDTIGLIEQIVRREAPNFVSLGKRLLLMLETMNPKEAVSQQPASKKTSRKSTAKESSAA